MGIFNSEGTLSLYNESVEPAREYYGVDAGARIKLEGYQNDMALFTAILKSDFKSEEAKHEGALDEATAITEGTVGDIFNKIKELIKKLWAKIKGLVQSFLTRFIAVFIRDNKKLVKKYHKQIMKQMTDSKRKYNEMTFKMHEGFYNALTEDKSLPFPITGAVEWARATSAKVTGHNDFKATSLEQLKEGIEKHGVEFLNKQWKINMSDFSDLRKELDDEYIGSVDEYEGYTSSINSSVEQELENAAKGKKEIERNQRQIDSNFRSYLKEIDNSQKAADKLVVGKDASKDEVSQDTKDEKVKAANIEYFVATKTQSITSEVTTWFLGYIKSYCKEVRSLYIKAAARRAMKEDANVLDDIIDEAVAYDIDSLFEGDVDVDIDTDSAAAEIDGVDDITAE